MSLRIEKNTLQQFNWSKGGGLIPVIVQDYQTQVVLMLGYVNQDAWRQTLETKEVTFFSRTRQCLWRKGETSGNTLQLIEWYVDCDQDAILVQARPCGPTCHLKRNSCFNALKVNCNELERLERTVLERAREQDVSSSYTARLIGEGVQAVAQKVGEEAVETVIAGCVQSDEALLNESADLLYHWLVLLCVRNLTVGQVMNVLKQRNGQSLHSNGYASV